MKLSIISVNYRSWGHLESALDALAADFPADWELIVVDNESDPDDFEPFTARYPWVSFVANPENSGFGAGCIMGVERATGEQLLFMNPDVIATQESIRRLIEIKAQSGAAIIAPKQVGTEGRLQKVFDEFPNFLNQSKTLKAVLRILMQKRTPDPRADHRELVWCDWVTGSVLLIDRADYDSIGGWSKDYWMYVEDADLCKKAHDRGMRVAYTPDVEVVHAHGGSSRINVDVKAMTKVEVIISKHVYTSRHERGFRCWLMHNLIFNLRVPALVVGALLDLLTFGKIPPLNVRSRMLVQLMRYYAGALQRQTWVSPRALAPRG